MNSNAVKASGRRVRRCAKPLDIRRGNPKIVLCIHGFTGYPGEMAYPASRLTDAGWDVRVPRLTGHGTDGRDFASVSLADLRRQVADEWLNLTAEYDEVCVLGHSMGGLLTLDLARNYPVHSAVVLAPAIGIKVPGGSFLKLISLFIRRKPVSWKPDPEYVFFDERDEDDDEFLGGEYWSWIWFRQASQLISLQNKTARHLADITTPILGIFAGKDTVVGNRGELILKNSLPGSFRSLVLPGSRHYIPYDPDPDSRQAAMDAALQWFDGEAEITGQEAIRA